MREGYEGGRGGVGRDRLGQGGDRKGSILLDQRNWVFATDFDFTIPIALHPDVVDLLNFKLWILLDQIFLVLNIKGLQNQVVKI